MVEKKKIIELIKFLCFCLALLSVLGVVLSSSQDLYLLIQLFKKNILELFKINFELQNQILKNQEISVNPDFSQKEQDLPEKIKYYFYFMLKMLGLNILGNHLVTPLGNELVRLVGKSFAWCNDFF